jgi:hypothetical protein
MKVPKPLRPTALSGALLAAAVASVPSSAEAAPPADHDYGYGDQAYAPTFGYDAAYYVRPLGDGGFRQFGGWYGQPYGYGGYYVYGYRGHYGYGGHRRWSRR